MLSIKDYKRLLKKRLNYMLPIRDYKNTHRINMKEEKTIFRASRNQKKIGLIILYQTK